MEARWIGGAEPVTIPDCRLALGPAAADVAETRGYACDAGDTGGVGGTAGEAPKLCR